MQQLKRLQIRGNKIETKKDDEPLNKVIREANENIAIALRVVLK